MFKNVPLGEYLLRIRYKKDVLDTVYKEYSVAIKIAPFWYHTIWAYLTLVLLIILCLAGYICKLHRKGFFERLARAWAVSKGLGEIQQENLLVKASALGNWVAFFPYCNQPEQITFIQRIIEINSSLKIRHA